MNIKQQLELARNNALQNMDIFPNVLKETPHWGLVEHNPHKDTEKTFGKKPALFNGQLGKFPHKNACRLLKENDNYIGLSFNFKETPYGYSDIDSYKKEADKALHAKLVGTASKHTYVEKPFNGGSHIVYEGEGYKSGDAIDNRTNNLLFMTEDSIGQKEIKPLSKKFLKVSKFIPIDSPKKNFKKFQKEWKNKGSKTAKDYQNDRSRFCMHLMNIAYKVVGNDKEELVNIVAKKMDDPTFLLRRIKITADKVLDNYSTGEGLEDFRGDIMSIGKVQKMHFDPINYVVKGLLPIGLTILAGRPKVGKSFLSLDLAYAVSTGRKFMGKFKTTKATTLTISCEESKRIINSRTKDMPAFPDNALMINKAPIVGKGFSTFIRKVKKNYPNLKLVIVDTVIHILPPNKSNNNEYSFLYPILSEIHNLAHELSVAIVMTYHLKKANAMTQGGNVFDEILGSTVFQGASDCLIVIKRKPDEKEGQFYFTGREVKGGVFDAIFHKKKWEFDGITPIGKGNDNDMIIAKVIGNDSLTFTAIAKKTGLNHTTLSRRLKKNPAFIKKDKRWSIDVSQGV